MWDKETFIDYYRILQVHQDADFEIIKSAYRRLAQMHHPDLQADKAAVHKMQQINEAYQIISSSEQRLEYHKHWLEQQRKKSGRIQRTTAAAHTDPPANLAMRALDTYFRALLSDNWQQAYAGLTRYDQRMVSLEDFCAWKDAVRALYQMGSYVIKPFRSYERCVINTVEYASMHVFTVFLTDRDTRTGNVSEETYTKHVVIDRADWRVCLGYKDLKSIIYKLKYLATQAPVLDVNHVYTELMLKYDKLTGLFSNKGLAERLEQEITRLSRHQGSCCLAVISLEASGSLSGISQTEYMCMCLSQAASQLKATLRNTDVAGRLSENQLVVLLVDTAVREAAFALDRYVKNIRPADSLVYKVWGSLTDCTADSPETLLLQAKHDAIQAESQRDGQHRSTHVPLDSQQV